ncbi:MAG: hypothetical protein V4443_12230 [Pseudomonadota bacterium]
MTKRPEFTHKPASEKLILLRNDLDQTADRLQTLRDHLALCTEDPILQSDPLTAAIKSADTAQSAIEETRLHLAGIR